MGNEQDEQSEQDKMWYFVIGFCLGYVVATLIYMFMGVFDPNVYPGNL